MVLLYVKSKYQPHKHNVHQAKTMNNSSSLPGTRNVTMALHLIISIDVAAQSTCTKLNSIFNYGPYAQALIQDTIHSSASILLRKTLHNKLLTIFSATYCDVLLEKL